MTIFYMPKPTQYLHLKEHSTFLEIGSFYNSLRVKYLSLTIFFIHLANLRVWREHF